MILAAREPRATPRRSVHLTSHCPSTAPISSSNRSLTHPATNRYPYTRPWDISAGLPESGLEVRLRGLQSIRIKRRQEAMADILGYARVSTMDQDLDAQRHRLVDAGAILIFDDV